LIAGFYDSKCLTLLQAHNYAYVILPIIRWVRRFSKSSRKDGVASFSMISIETDGHSWTVDFPVYIDCTYLNGKYDENGVATRLRR